MRKLIITLTKAMVYQEDNEGKARVMCTGVGTHSFAEHMREGMDEPNMLVAVQDQATHPFPGCPACGHPMNGHIHAKWGSDQICIGPCKEPECHCRYWIEAVKEVILP